MTTKKKNVQLYAQRRMPSVLQYDAAAPHRNSGRREGEPLFTQVFAIHLDVV